MGYLLEYLKTNKCLGTVQKIVHFIFVYNQRITEAEPGRIPLVTWKIKYVRIKNNKFYIFKSNANIQVLILVKNRYPEQALKKYKE